MDTAELFLVRALATNFRDPKTKKSVCDYFRAGNSMLIMIEISSTAHGAKADMQSNFTGKSFPSSERRYLYSFYRTRRNYKSSQLGFAASSIATIYCYSILP
jgi:hypothetical protein